MRPAMVVHELALSEDIFVLVGTCCANMREPLDPTLHRIFNGFFTGSQGKVEIEPKTTGRRFSAHLVGEESSSKVDLEGLKMLKDS